MEKIQHKRVSTNGINMHVALIGSGPVILFLHGFPELWHSWRHQLLSLSSLGYRCLAPDLRGYGDTDAPASASEYTVFHIVGDLIGMLDALGIEEQVFLVGHDWGAYVAWHFCMFRPDKVKALVNTGIAYLTRNPQSWRLELFSAAYGDDHYICRFQEPGEAEEDFAQVDTAKLLTRLYTAFSAPDPPIVPKGFRSFPDPPSLPSWLSIEDVNYCATQFNKTGFTGGLNYYRVMNLNWELTAPWTGVQIETPVKFITGDLDVTYNIPGMKEYIHGGGFKKHVPQLEEVVVLEGVPHFLNQVKPEEVSKHIYDFIKKL